MTESLSLTQIRLTPPQVGLTPPQALFRPLALAVFVLQIGIEHCILQRDAGLRGQQFQHRDASRREGARSQIVLEVQCADELGLLDQREAEYRAGPSLPHVRIFGEQSRRGGVIEDYAL